MKLGGRVKDQRTGQRGAITRVHVEVKSDLELNKKQVADEI